jgi:hypothetical protein
MTTELQDALVRLEEASRELDRCAVHYSEAAHELSVRTEAYYQDVQRQRRAWVTAKDAYVQALRAVWSAEARCLDVA